jgi:hypothetical protein
MAKTTFSSGVIVTSQWLNGAQQIYFDGQDLDWHYPPLGLNSFVRTGPNGLDAAYVTLDTDQPELTPGGLYISGTPIGGSKVVTGIWNFGFDPNQATNPANDPNNAPRSYTTNTKFDAQVGTADQKFQALNEADLVTKEVLKQWVEYIIETLEVDNGVYYSASNPACNNYSAVGGSDVICPN